MQIGHPRFLKTVRMYLMNGLLVIQDAPRDEDAPGLKVSTKAQQLQINCVAVRESAPGNIYHVNCHCGFFKSVDRFKNCLNSVN